MSNVTFYFIILVLMYKYTSSYLMGMQSFTYSTFMEYQKIMLYTQDVWGKKDKCGFCSNVLANGRVKQQRNKKANI